MNRKLTITLLVAAVALIGVLGVLAAPPPPPPPPVPQNIGFYDTSVDHRTTNSTDQTACRVCHQSNGTVSGSYNNTLGGVPTRHHNMVLKGTINPYTNASFGCPDCHPALPTGGILIDHSCQDCHNGTAFWGDSAYGAQVGNFTRPHHIDTSRDTANIGEPAQNRTCNFCHGSVVSNYNDGHSISSTATSFGFTPFATYKQNSTLLNLIPVYNSGGAEVLNKTYGGCESCHLADPNATPYPIGSNHDNHHKEILGFARFGGKTPYQNATTPFINVSNTCSVCHVIDYTNSTGRGSSFPLLLNITNPTTGEILNPAIEIRNSTIEQADAAIGAFEPGTVNITINGTGCEKCHSMQSLLNIQDNYSLNGPQGHGHINNASDCYGCHNTQLAPPAPLVGAIIPTVYGVSPAVISAGVTTTLTVTGINFENPDSTYNTTIAEISGMQFQPLNLTQTQMIVNVSNLTAGAHDLQLVKGVDTLSNLVPLTVVKNPTITSVTYTPDGTLNINGAGFGAMPATNAKYYVSVSHNGTQIISSNISEWNDTQIIAQISGVAAGDQATVWTAASGEAIAPISVLTPTPTPTPISTSTPTSTPTVMPTVTNATRSGT